MATKKLSESQAWMKLARLWDKPSKLDGGCIVRIGSKTSDGLCRSAFLLHLAGDISLDLDLLMDARIAKHRPRKNRLYAWDFDAKGAKARAAFCRKMAVLAKKKKVAR